MECAEPHRAGSGQQRTGLRDAVHPSRRRSRSAAATIEELAGRLEPVGDGERLVRRPGRSSVGGTCDHWAVAHGPFGPPDARLARRNQPGPSADVQGTEAVGSSPGGADSTIGGMRRSAASEAMQAVGDSTDSTAPTMLAMTRTRSIRPPNREIPRENNHSPLSAIPPGTRNAGRWRNSAAAR